MNLHEINRRTFLGRGAAGLGLVAFNSLMRAATPSGTQGAVNPLDFFQLRGRFGKIFNY